MRSLEWIKADEELAAAEAPDVLHTFDVVVRVKLTTDQIDTGNTLLNYAYMGREKFSSLIWSEDPAAPDHVAAAHMMHRAYDMTIKVDMLTDGSLRLSP